MTDNDTTDTMAEIDHTNPYTGETAGQLFSRGPIVVADGGERAAADSTPADDDDGDRKQTMKDVPHTPPHDADDANRVFERGRNADSDPVEDEE
ncbi:hypothetical protein [Halopiger djelfimassiliensis]|uniref:hypothetical protein n=1 Tax=Halopiger djelfimassiliensis TaxID=1293047 RepID=UPI0006781366|nr:hypothetical protein [Halopiger djelfimassiliensis]